MILGYNQGIKNFVSDNKNRYENNINSYCCGLFK